jgi:hypothetical protein
MSGKNMFPVPEMQKGPQLAVSFKDDMSSLSSITPVRTSLGDELFGSQMGRTCAPFAGSAENANIIYKI